VYGSLKVRYSLVLGASLVSQTFAELKVRRMPELRRRLMSRGNLDSVEPVDDL